jgi:hypothetical protein
MNIEQLSGIATLIVTALIIYKGMRTAPADIAKTYQEIASKAAEDAQRSAERAEHFSTRCSDLEARLEKLERRDEIFRKRERLIWDYVNNLRTLLSEHNIEVPVLPELPTLEEA